MNEQVVWVITLMEVRKIQLATNVSLIQKLLKILW